MAEDYESAAKRHFLDATLLKGHGHLDGAGHLVGFAAECAIKFRIESLRPGNDAPYGHLPDLLHAARKHLGQRSSYAAMYEVLKGNHFSTWNVSRRYEGTGDTTVEELNAWFEVTKRLFATASIRNT
ncbi:hypothetical protein ACN9MB_03380 [Dyella kyungheensis]|uniref:hypothetical protein n=1 Tax=Dyella kyungheensis TaxID=1242174 RepID=UPI003CF7BF99